MRNGGADRVIRWETAGAVVGAAAATSGGAGWSSSIVTWPGRRLARKAQQHRLPDASINVSRTAVLVGPATRADPLIPMCGHGRSMALMHSCKPLRVGIDSCPQYSAVRRSCWRDARAFSGAVRLHVGSSSWWPRIRTRWPMTAHAAASYGDRRPPGADPGTGPAARRSPGHSGPRGSQSRPRPVTGTERFARRAVSGSRPAAAGLTTSHSAPVLAHLYNGGLPGPSQRGSHLQRLPCRPGVGRWTKPSRNLVLAASENEPRAVRANVPIAAQPCTVMT